MSEIAETVLVNIDELKINKNVVKVHSEAQLHDIGILVDKIKFTDPCIIDSDKEVWSGKGRVLVAKSKGMKQLPCVFMPEDWTEDDKKAYMIMVNRVNESPWMAEKLKIVLDDLPKLVFEEYHLKLDNILQDNPNIPQDEWAGMPEFKQEDQDALRKIELKFTSEDDVKVFAEIIGQNITDLTRWLWFPKKETEKMDKTWEDEP